MRQLTVLTPLELNHGAHRDLLGFAYQSARQDQLALSQHDREHLRRPNLQRPHLCDVVFEQVVQGDAEQPQDFSLTMELTLYVQGSVISHR